MEDDANREMNLFYRLCFSFRDAAVAERSPPSSVHRRPIRSFILRMAEFQDRYEFDFSLFFYQAAVRRSIRTLMNSKCNLPRARASYITGALPTLGWF